ncbi:MAG: BlaI/MecI/CopY family transcriptional regulator [Erysipelotrichaceae bacterium]|nr:BlaI/MecI/CopY family transcriptional regulator [Erysipelotrichaceae bacterium]
MDEMKLGVMEGHFADMIWQNEPIASGELVKRALTDFGWKKSTTYTVLKKLIDRGMFKNENGVVTSLISREQFDSMQSEKFVNETFNGSLPAFIAAFASRKPLTTKEIQEIQKMIDEFGKEE